MSYISYMLEGADFKYPLAENLAYALILASWKLRRYCEVHKVIV